MIGFSLAWDMLLTVTETGGFGDHVVPFHSPPNTPGDWMKDPYGTFGDVYVGPGKSIVLGLDDLLL